MLAPPVSMNNAIYVALSRQTGLFRNLDVAANNVANVNTPGFKGETMVFEKYLVNDKDNFSRKIAFAHNIATFVDYGNGAVKQTGRDLDMAIEGEGFFKIQTPQGVRYTRQGNFHMNPDGEVVTSEGYPVLGSSDQSIRLQQDDIDLKISSDGTIRVNDVGEPRGKIELVHFENPQKLIRMDQGLYRSEEDPIRTATPGHLIQGALEESNVSAVTELTNLININRSVGAVSSFMADMHDLTRRAITAYTRAT